MISDCTVSDTKTAQINQSSLAEAVRFGLSITLSWCLEGQTWTGGRSSLPGHIFPSNPLKLPDLKGQTLFTGRVGGGSLFLPHHVRVLFLQRLCHVHTQPSLSAHCLLSYRVPIKIATRLQLASVTLKAGDGWRHVETRGHSGDSQGVHRETQKGGQRSIMQGCRVGVNKTRVYSKDGAARRARGTARKRATPPYINVKIPITDFSRLQSQSLDFASSPAVWPEEHVHDTGV